jgi:hypothetical protein
MMRTTQGMALKTIDQIVTARSRMIGAQTGSTPEQALANTKGSFAVVRPGFVTRYVGVNGGWTTDPAQALTWSNTADLLRACYKLNVSGLRIVNAPTADDITAGKKVIEDAAALRATAIAANVAAKKARRAKRLSEQSKT